MRSRWWITVLGAVALAWCGGLAWFVNLVPEGSEIASEPTDAIVVLTGGSLRVDNGLSLLAEGKAKKLFVSGVYRSTDVRALLRASSQEPRWLACCIELGHEADNTHGNAVETAAWMHAEHFHSLRLVTASYHMPRSLLEFSRTMPEMLIVPHPVFPQAARRPWWLSPHGAMLIVAEYNKYLFALTGIQSWASAP